MPPAADAGRCPSQDLDGDVPGSHVGLISDVVKKFLGSTHRFDLRPCCLLALDSDTLRWTALQEEEELGVVQPRPYCAVTCYTQAVKLPGSSSYKYETLYVGHEFPAHFLRRRARLEHILLNCNNDRQQTWFLPESYDLRIELEKHKKNVAFTTAKACAIWLMDTIGIGRGGHHLKLIVTELATKRLLLALDSGRTTTKTLSRESVMDYIELIDATRGIH
ncbi:unnamed protein product [Amoebophrya sp. A120]|nr:unnamed protein product [Amoebophrya sp. A120]|eukprot:GSA120T00003415001.1